MMSCRVTKIAVGFGSILLVVTAFAVPQASSQDAQPTHQHILNAVNAPPTRQDILSGVGNVQTSVNSLQNQHTDQTAGINALSADHAAQSAAHTALSQKIDQIKTAVDNLSTNADLSGLPPTWDRVLPAHDTGDPCNSSRFKCVMSGEAVLDKETGLVWERTPSLDGPTWGLARIHCSARIVGGRKAMRVPSVHELASLLDPSNSNPALPTGHPFNDVQSSFYWSASTVVGSPEGAGAWGVGFGDGVVGARVKSDPFFVWCVRGGMNADQY